MNLTKKVTFNDFFNSTVALVSKKEIFSCPCITELVLMCFVLLLFAITILYQ